MVPVPVNAGEKVLGGTRNTEVFRPRAGADEDRLAPMRRGLPRARLHWRRRRNAGGRRCAPELGQHQRHALQRLHARTAATHRAGRQHGPAHTGPVPRRRGRVLREHHESGGSAGRRPRAEQRRRTAGPPGRAARACRTGRRGERIGVSDIVVVGTLGRAFGRLLRCADPEELRGRPVLRNGQALPSADVRTAISASRRILGTRGRAARSKSEREEQGDGSHMLADHGLQQNVVGPWSAKAPVSSPPLAGHEPG